MKVMQHNGRGHSEGKEESKERHWNALACLPACLPDMSGFGMYLYSIDDMTSKGG